MTTANNANRWSVEAPLIRLPIVAPSTDSLAPKSEENQFMCSLESKLQATPEARAEEGKPDSKIPDGGWGWVVVFATFLLCMIADGVTFSFGLLYVEFLKEFEASNSATSWIGSLFMAVPLLSGPIMSALVDKFGCRSMTIVGGIISASGFILSSKCYSLNLMYLTFGMLAGLGLGLIYVTVVVSVAFWFEKRRTLAVGIGSSGIGIGTFIFSPLTTYLIMEFGWRGTTLILGGCFLNMCVCGTLMRDPDWIIEQDRLEAKSKLSKSTKSSKDSLENSINLEELKAFLTSEKDVKLLLNDLEESLDGRDKDTLKNYFSAVNLPTFIKKHETVPVEVLQLLTTNKNALDVILHHYSSLVVPKKKSEDTPSHNQGDLVRAPSIQKAHWTKHKPEEAHETPIGHTKSYHESYFKNLKLDTHSLAHRGALFNTSKYRFKASSCPNIYRVSMVSLPRKDSKEVWYSELVDLVKGMFDFSLFLELHFCLLSLSTIILFTWFIVPYFYLVTLMTNFEYTTEQASFTISNIGISNTLGMIVLGWAGDRPWMNITKTCAICLVVCGLSVAGQMLFIKNYFMLQVSSSLFGLSLASHFTFTPGIVMELVPLDRFTIAYGLQLLCQGIGTLVGPPYAGLLYDITQSWEQTFYQAAIWIILSGIFVAIIPYIRNRKMFGRGSVEKEVDDPQSHYVPLVLLFLAMMLAFIGMFYLTAMGFQSYLRGDK
ncbi:monocarboxylate transporter 13 [Dendroctonus ponderosae]|uniref:Major facilitator superfamily (MFS) profile domain-containing protein n=2 Tax=Dendroctonus ponderosae TaxID=77166 RepID=A0AAR5PHG8_DENPD|nr:monocarboxylate transporter 13 [Dendroctonus ponderosae]XP_019760322.1 monocarboxylate transporter 13 [Dendroctonus ponderosae]XP_019760323.1 monocarboxylate transporter 13 [Dendroctonus ponderosae]KAH1025339.1 hypothetical protein HUJ05_010080 [Dendroctonus ponderosae]